MNNSLTIVTRALDTLLKSALVALMSILVLSTTWQVVSRYLLGDPSSWTEELARFSLIWAGLLGAVYAYRTHAHIGIDVRKGTLTEKNRRILDISLALCVLVFAFFVVVVGGTNLVLITLLLEQTSAALGWQMAWVYSVLPVCGLWIIWYALVDIVSLVRGPDTDGPLDEGV